MVSGGIGGGTFVEFDNARVNRSMGSDPPMSCWGDCSFAENDFSRPPLLPSDPTTNLHFARSDWRATGSITGSPGVNTSLNLNMVAEMELDHGVSQGQWFARGLYQRFMLFNVNFTDEVVFDFDADVLMRSLNHVDVADTSLEASTLLEIILTDSSGTELFRFNPNGTGVGNAGGAIISDPFDLNGTLRVNRYHPLFSVKAPDRVWRSLLG